MTPTEQLTYVERYFEGHRGRVGDLDSLYTSILAGHPASGDDALFTQGTTAYHQNRELDIDRAAVYGALAAYTQAGRAMYDLDKHVYRVRELSRDPLPMAKLRFANEREEAAQQLVNKNEVALRQTNASGDGGVTLRGRVRDDGRNYDPELTIDRDERLASATCTCNFYQQNKLYKGPCEHILALRIYHRKTKPEAI